MQKLTNYFIHIVTFLLFIIIFFFSFSYDSSVYYQDNVFLSLLFAIITLIIWTFIYWIIYKKIKIPSKKWEIIFLIIYFMVVSLLQIIVLKQLSVAPGWDFGMVFSNAKAFVYTGVREINVYPEYFQFFPNNIMLFVFEVIFIKIGSLFHIEAIYSVYIMNIVFIDMALLLLYLTIRKISNSKNAMFGLILTFFFLSLFLYTPIIYSDTMTLFIPVGFVYLFSLKDDKKVISKRNIIIFILIGILLFLGKELKITSLIIFIALTMGYFIVKFKLIKFVNIGISLSVLIICELLFKITIVNNDKFQFQVNDYGSVPVTHWVMMGVEDIDADNSGRNSYGGYNEADYKLTESFATGKDAIKFNLTETMNRINKMGVGGYANYLIKKSVNTWTDGYYFSNIKLSINSNHQGSLLYKLLIANSKSADIFRTISQGIQYAFIITLLMNCILKIKSNKSFDYLKLTLIGLVIFFLLWENRSRYIFNFIPVFILIIVDSYDDLKNKVASKKCLKLKKKN